MLSSSALCRSCRAPLVDKVLDLGPQPASDFFPLGGNPDADPRWPLELWMCSKCGLAQLGVDAAIPETPLALESGTMRQHAAEASAEVLRQTRLTDGATVAEAASHHGGSWLPHLVRGGLQTVPLSANHAADLLVDVHALAHEPDTDRALKAHARRLRAGGQLVIEFHHLLPLVRDGQFDTVRHGHPVYLSLLALRPALARQGLTAIRAKTSDAYGGSLRVTARFSTEGVMPDISIDNVLEEERAAGLNQVTQLQDLQPRAIRSSKMLRDYLRDAQRRGRLVLGYGAPSKASVLLCSSNIDSGLLPFTADLSPAKQGRRLPGCGVPIRSPADLLAARPDDVLILSWDIACEVATQLADVRTWGGRFFVPLPEPHELAASPHKGADGQH